MVFQRTEGRDFSTPGLQQIQSILIVEVKRLILPYADGRADRSWSVRVDLVARRRGFGRCCQPGDLTDIDCLLYLLDYGFVPVSYTHLTLPTILLV